MSENQADRADVKAFAKTMAEDHTKSYERLTELAAKEGITIPKGINVAKDRTFEQLARLKGKSYDRQFTNDEIVSHRHALIIFRREAAHAQDADVKAYAASMIPVLENHLRLAEQCARQEKRS